MDIDIVAFALCHLFNLDLLELWIEIRTEKNWRWLPNHLHAETLHPEMCQVMPFWVTLTGSDSVSIFADRGKNTAWSVWQRPPEAAQVFKR